MPPHRWLVALLLVASPLARGDEPPAVGAPAQTPASPTGAPQPEPPPAPRAQLTGRVFERGSAVPIPGCSIDVGGDVPSGESVITDGDGHFTLDVPSGNVDLTLSAPGYEPLHLVEKLPPNTKRSIEYRLLPLPSGVKRRYRSTVRGDARREGERFTLKDEELQQVPGAVGDPFRVIATLPGVIAPVPLLPIYVVRGGSPGMNGFFLDGMRVPQLFHMVLVDGVVHPRLLDQIDFYPGSYDATFGRYASGIVDAKTRSARTDAPYHGEVELKLYDASALVEGHYKDLQILAAGRYGYPGPMIRLVQPGVDVNYWDYQFRADWRGLTLEALGSYDSLSIDLDAVNGRPPSGSTPAESFLVEFHRLQLRDVVRRGSFEIDGAIVGGLDRMSIFGGQGVQKLALSARVDSRFKWWQLAFAAGGDVEVSRFTAQNFDTSAGTTDNGQAPDELGELSGNRDGVVGGAYAQATLSFDDWLARVHGGKGSITAGVRADAYHAGAITLLGVDPRVLFRYAPFRQLEFFGGFGQYTQAPSFPIPLPGIDTFALQLGLQKAVQGSVGMRVKLPEDVSVSATGYYGRFDNINDVVIDFVSAACTSPPPESLTGIAAYVTRQVRGDAYGLELLARKQGGRVSGWISYTLSRAERIYSCGLAPSDFDQTHVLNAVVQVRLPWRMMFGGHLQFSTGRPYTQLMPDIANASFTGDRNNQRMPNYFQLDLRVDREWIFQKWALAAFLEALNVTYSQSVYGVTYPKQDPATVMGTACPTASATGSTATLTRYDCPLFEGFRWILPSIGVRGRF